jgi:hypothetical protein
MKSKGTYITDADGNFSLARMPGIASILRSITVVAPNRWFAATSMERAFAL